MKINRLKICWGKTKQNKTKQKTAYKWLVEKKFLTANINQ